MFKPKVRPKPMAASVGSLQPKTAATCAKEGGGNDTYFEASGSDSVVATTAGPPPRGITN
jgi:hypothetical protein